MDKYINIVTLLGKRLTYVQVQQFLAHRRYQWDHHFTVKMRHLGHKENEVLHRLRISHSDSDRFGELTDQCCENSFDPEILVQQIQSMRGWNDRHFRAAQQMQNLDGKCERMIVAFDCVAENLEDGVRHSFLGDGRMFECSIANVAEKAESNAKL